MILSEPKPPVDLRQIAIEHQLKTECATWAAAGRPPESAELWSVLIPGKHGHVRAHSPDELVARCVTRRLFKRIRTVPDVRFLKEDRDEVEVAFPLTSFRAFSSILKLKFNRTQAGADETTSTDDDHQGEGD